MHPRLHIILTLLLSLPFASKMRNPSIIFFALISTVLIDFFDHALYLLFSKDDLAVNTKIHIKRREILTAWNYYYSNRKGRIDFLMIHNLISFSLLSIITLLLYNINRILFYIIALGIIFHLICDLFEDLVLKRNEKYWYTGWKIFLDNIRHLKL